MKKSKKKLFDFHFKMDTEMKTALKRVPLYKKYGSLSGLIVRVLTMLAPQLEKEHLKKRQRNSMYRFIHDDIKIKRESTHAYMPDSLYRKLKLLHNDLNLYSIAQLVRLVLRIFLFLYQKYGNKTVSELIRLFRKWRKKRINRKYHYKSMRQLLHFIYQKPRISNFFTIYSYKFEPINIFRL